MNSFNFIHCASDNDLLGVKSIWVKGVDINFTDYDGRSAAHLSASKGNMEVIKCLQENGANFSLIDRWGNTPKYDTIRENHNDVNEFLSNIISENSPKRPKLDN